MTFIRKPAVPEAFDYAVEREIATISEDVKGVYSLQFTRTSFNGKPAKLDLRSWKNFSDPAQRQMQKGLQLCEEEARELLTALQAYFAEKDGAPDAV